MSQFKSGVSTTGGEPSYAASTQRFDFPNGFSSLSRDRSKLPMPILDALIHVHDDSSLRENMWAPRTSVRHALWREVRVVRQTNPGHEDSPLFIQGDQRETGNPP
jgi:hypothetical protein